IDDAVVVAPCATSTPTVTVTASEARVRANRENAQKSTGPTSEEGKAQSRTNGLKHGLSGAGVVMPEAMRIEVDRLIDQYTRDYRPTNERERDLVRQRALGLMRSRVAWNAETIFALNWAERAGSPTTWESDRKAEAAEMGARLERRPGVVVARLEGSLQG